MPTMWICVRLAVATCDTGMPSFTTRVPWPTIVVDGTVWLKTCVACWRGKAW
jgi:hypothetical protein